MEFEKSYVFEPSEKRPAKRRKVEYHGLQASWKRRKELYHEAWKAQEERINERLNAINATTVYEVATFLDDHVAFTAETGIPTGIICTGPDAASHTSIFDQLSKIPCAHGKRIYVSLNAGQCTNLKAVLKTIIQKATSGKQGIDDEEDDQIGTFKGSGLLNYDLQILHEYVKHQRIKQVVLALHDTEAFDSHLLSEMIEILGCWNDRIPFAILLSMATSLDFLQQRLSKEAVKWFRGRLFDVAPSGEEVEQVVEAVIDPRAPIWIGPGLMRFALERQSDYVQSINSFVDAVQYAYMSTYYANALSIFLDTATGFWDIPKDHFEAARNLDSFANYCKHLLESNQPARVMRILENDEALFKEIISFIGEARAAFIHIRHAIKLIRALQRTLPNQQIASTSSLYIQALSNKLNDSSLVRSLLLLIRKSPSDTALGLLDAVIDCYTSNEFAGNRKEQCVALKTALTELLERQDSSAQPLRSEDDVKNSTLRTTVIAQKVELSKQKSSLSKQDAAYTAILRRFTDMLEEYFAASFKELSKLPFHEVFLYDLKSPHREVFTPRPRHAVERALASPHDYLACDCCAPTEGSGDESTLSACQPATAVLYQLYLESGSLINASDLWQAFQAVMGDDRPEEENMASFQRALAELQYLGLVKNTRKRVDHIAKVAWRGL